MYWKFCIKNPKPTQIVSQSKLPCHPPYAAKPNAPAATAPPNTWIKPDKNERIEAARKPPLWLAYTANVALSKNTGTNPVMINTGDLNTINPRLLRFVLIPRIRNQLLQRLENQIRKLQHSQPLA